MPIELNKILGDIAAESSLKPTTTAKKEEIEQAWMRVSKKSNLSVHETKSIFKVLQKKFEQERQKENSTWKLFDVMNEIHTPAEEEDDEESDVSMEENEEYEMLEVDEEQQQEQNENEEKESVKSEQSQISKTATLKKTSTEMTSDGESPTKSKSDTSHENSPERAVEKQTESKKNATSPQTTSREEKKLLNLLLSPNSSRAPKAAMTATTAALALQKKGITLKKANPSQNPQQQQQQTAQVPHQVTAQSSLLRNAQKSEFKTIQLPETVKRKLNEETASLPPATKKMLLGQPSGNVKPVSPRNAKTLIQGKLGANGSLLKKDSEEKMSTSLREENANAQSEGILSATMTCNTNSSLLNTPTVTALNQGLKVYTFPVETKSEPNSALKVITLPAEGNSSLIVNGIAGSVEKKSTTNGISTTQIDELDFSDHVLISTNAGNNAGVEIKREDIDNTSPDTKDCALNLGNFSNELPRAFFNNLCNSKRYEAFALYVANAMNRLDSTIAARLEVTIMRALLDAQSEALKKS